MQDVLEKTGFLTLFTKKKQATEEVSTPRENPADEPKVVISTETDNDETPQGNGPQEVVIHIDETPPGKVTIQKNTRKARVFFISITDDGGIELKGIIRSVEYIDAPLRSTLDVLFKGPTHNERSQGLITMISPDVNIRNIYIKANTAYLDFSEAFQFNTLGKEGLEAQLKQIVFSTTEFTNIDQVQILIEGKKSEYLGPEGIYIGGALSRKSFKS